MSLTFGKIRPWSKELAALERLKKSDRLTCIVGKNNITFLYARYTKYIGGI